MSGGADLAAAADLLTRSLSEPPESELDDLDRAFDELGGGAAATAMLASARADESSLERIAANSYSHVNGFDKLVLLASPRPEYELRLHVWWPGEAEPVRWGGDFRTHDHRWNFTSYLLLGSLRSRWFETCDAGGREVWEYCYEPPEGADSFRMRLVGRARIRCVLDARIQAGDRYSLAHTMQHQVSSDRGRPAVSLMLRGRTFKPSTRVLTAERIGARADVPVERFDPPRLGETLERLSELLAER